MNAALPSNLFNPSFAQLEQTADTEDITFAKETEFLFKCWQSYDVSAQYGDDLAYARCRNLFWRVWSNPKLRPISNQEFNQLWQRCGRTTPLGPYRPNPAVWPKVQRPKWSPQIQVLAPQSPRGPPSPASPRITKISFDQDTFEPPSRSGRERGSGGTSATASSRPTIKRTPSARTTVPSAPSRGPKSRPALARRKSSQTRSSARASDTTIARVSSQDEPKPQVLDKRQSMPSTGPKSSSLRAKGPMSRPAFEIASSWQSDEDSNDDKASASVLGPTGSLVQPDFRSKFAEQRQLFSGTSLPAADVMHKVRSSVRFAEDCESTGQDKGKGRPDSGDDRTTESRTRPDSQVFADSDDSDELGDIRRVQSQLSMLIHDRRKQSGSQDLGPSSQPDGERYLEARRKRDELLKMGREAAAPIIPTSRSRRPSREREEQRYRSPSPNATF